MHSQEVQDKKKNSTVSSYILHKVCFIAETLNFGFSQFDNPKFFTFFSKFGM